MWNNTPIAAPGSIFVPLRPARLDDSLIGQPLAWDLYTASGVLVAGAGMVIADAGQLGRLKARPLYHRADAGIDETAWLERLRQALQSYPDTLEAAGADLERGIRALVSELSILLEQDHDACLGLTRRLPMRDPAVRHCLVSALIALDLAGQMSLSGSETESLSAAALTMNVSAMRLHADLDQGFVPFSPEIRAAMRRHPDDGAGRLAASGIDDPVWLAAVRQHHENLDGSGYPLGLRDDGIAMSARLIRVADYYAAKISGRHYRPPKSPQFAIKQLFGSERGRLDSQAATLSLRCLGLYPPGTLVRLATREIAVVTRKEGSGESAGHVMAFMTPNGRLLKEPAEHDTGLVNFAVLDVAEAQPNWPEIAWEAYWGY